MKICILSMQQVPNFGSLLQGFSLKKVLEELGHDVSFINIKRNEADDALLNGKRLEFSNENEGKKSKLANFDRYFFNRLNGKIQMEKQKKVYDLFRKQSMGISKSDDEESYDLCVIGSDEVFNCMVPSSWGFTSQLFGNVEQAGGVITYAASCGATTYDQLPENVKECIRNAFKNISAFSVRDQNTMEFVSKLSDQKIWRHLDPVVIGDFDREIAECRLPSNMPDKYCIVYSYYNRIHDENEIRAIKALCKKHHLEPVSLGTPQMWIKRHLVLSPFQALSAFKQAEFVVTDTFHGCILSAKYASRFATIIRPSNKNKLQDLIESLGITAHLADSADEIESIYSILNDTERIKKIAEKQKAISVEYLKAVIGSREEKEVDSK